MTTIKMYVLLASVLFVSGCATQATHLTLTDNKTSLVEMIPVRDFVANTGANFNYVVSPDGLKIAWIAVQGTQTKIHWRFINEEKTHVLSGDSGSDIHNFFWAQDSETLLSHGSAQQGTEQTHILALSIKHPDRNFIDITPFKNTKVRLIKTLRNDPEHFFVMANVTNKSEFDLYKINIRSKDFHLIEKNTGYVTRWYVDDNGKVRARMSVIDGTLKRLERFDSTQQKWQLVGEWSNDDMLRIAGFGLDNTAWILSNTNRDKTALFKLDLLTGERTFVYGDDEVSIDQIALSKISKQPLFSNAMPNYPKIHFFDQSVKDEFKYLQTKISGYIRILSSDNAENTVVLSSVSDKFVKHYVYQRSTQKLQQIGSHPLSQFSDILATTQAISYQSRDGLTINGYLTIPKGYEGKKLPMVLKVHGGPWARDRYGLNSNTQFLANRGYVVLQINYRGSTGYGKKFSLAGVGEFAQKMHTDLIDGVEWAIKQGVADKDKVCIYGRSYGGYSALIGLSQTPDVFTCGIDVAGPTDLVSLVENAPSYWKNYLGLWYQYVGNPAIEKQREDMRQRSPVYKAKQITKPLLIVHGARDPRVKLDQADRMVKALRKEGKEVDYTVFENEGHGITKWTNNLTFYRQLEDFLAKHLGGRSNGYDYYELGKIIY